MNENRLRYFLVNQADLGQGPRLFIYYKMSLHKLLIILHILIHVSLKCYVQSLFFFCDIDLNESTPSTIYSHPFIFSYDLM